jgi:hypothetical protein
MVGEVAMHVSAATTRLYDCYHQSAMIDMRVNNAPYTGTLTPDDTTRLRNEQLCLEDEASILKAAIHGAAAIIGL